jgi:hypothetical protein
VPIERRFLSVRGFRLGTIRIDGLEVVSAKGEDESTAGISFGEDTRFGRPVRKRHAQTIHDRI